MVGDDELAKLAALLKLSGEVAKVIAQARKADVTEIHRLAEQATAIATRLEALARKTESSEPPVDMRH